MTARVSLLSVTLLLASCGGAAATGPTTPPGAPSLPDWHQDLALLLPSDATAVLRLDVDAIERTPYFDAIAQLLINAVGAEGIRDPGGFLARTSELVVALSATGEEDVHVTVVARGQWQEGEAEAALAQAIGVEDGPYASGEIRRSDQGEAARVEPGVWALGDVGRVGPVLARAAGEPLDGPWSNPTLRRNAERARFGAFPVTAAFLVPAALRDSLRGSSSPLGSAMGEVLGGSLRIGLEGGVTVHLDADTSDAGVAREVAQRIDTTLRGFAQNPFVAMLGLSAILGRVQVDVEGPTFQIDAAASQEEVTSLLARFGSTLSSIVSGGGVPLP